MSPIHHAVISTGFAGVLYFWLGSWTTAVICLLSGVFIDIDHHIDYMITNKRFPWKYSDLYKFCSPDQKGKLYLIFHSYEMLVMFWIGLYLFEWPVQFLGLGVGLTTHVLSDQFANPLNPLAYFTTYRLKHDFAREFIFDKAYFAKYN